MAPARGYEVKQSEKEIAAEFVTFFIRYYNAKDVTPVMQIVHKLTGFAYDIRAISPIDFNRRMIEFTCRRVV